MEISIKGKAGLVKVADFGRLDAAFSNVAILCTGMSNCSFLPYKVTPQG